MERRLVHLFGNISARSVSVLRGFRLHSSSASDPVVQTLLSSKPPPPARTLSDLRRRLADECPSLSDFVYSVEAGTKKRPLPKPKWMKETIPGGTKYAAIKSKLRELKLHTVCEEARCPNLGECWSGGETGTATATIMILGDTCTCDCRFCNVKTSRAPPPPDPNEPSNVAEAIASWGLDYVVLTSVDRDDLPDQGSSHFTETVQKLKAVKPNILFLIFEEIKFVWRKFLNLVWMFLLTTLRQLKNCRTQSETIALTSNNQLMSLKWSKNMLLLAR